jgi:hypothetical protein
MDFDADVAAVVIAQKSPHPRLDRAACVMIRMHNLRLRIPTHPVGRSGDIRSAIPGYPVTAR